jgi:hypothetical protein
MSYALFYTMGRNGYEHTNHDSLQFYIIWIQCIRTLKVYVRDFENVCKQVIVYPFAEGRAGVVDLADFVSSANPFPVGCSFWSLCVICTTSRKTGISGWRNPWIKDTWNCYDTSTYRNWKTGIWLIQIHPIQTVLTMPMEKLSK